jgi:aspartyl-tRNA(Asn)/glutamyl-tRNA(Gln) amidotransferase subunit A
VTEIDPVWPMTVVDLAAAVRSGERTARWAVEQALAAIEARNDEVNAFVAVDVEGALASADEVDAAVARGEDPGPLAGVPFGVKDLEDAVGMVTSYGSVPFADHPPATRDSVMVGRMRGAGGIPVGKTAAPEFGTLQYTRSAAWGTTRNPWHPDRTPGGSSGGSGAAVAGGLVPIATASDGGGSTRIPASFSGLVGFKPTLGLIPHPDQIPSLTAVKGALTTTVRDAARHLDVSAGVDDRDRYSIPVPPALAGGSFEAAIEVLDVGGLRVMWSSDLGYAAVDPEVAELSAAAAEVLVAAAGLAPRDVDLALTDPVRTWLSAGSIDLWTDIERDMWPDRADDFTPFVRMALEVTADRPVRTLAPSDARRKQLDREVAAIFDRGTGVDVLLTPTTAVAAFAAEGPPPLEIAGRDVNPAMSVPFTMLANLCGNAACSVPAGVTSEGLPVGLQIIGRRHADATVLRLARIFEQAQPWARLAPGWPRADER